MVVHRAGTDREVMVASFEGLLSIILSAVGARYRLAHEAHARWMKFFLCWAAFAQQVGAPFAARCTESGRDRRGGRLTTVDVAKVWWLPNNVGVVDIAFVWDVACMLK